MKALIKIAVIKKGWTMKELAESLGMNCATLSRKLNGKNEFKISEIKKMSVLLDIDPAIFFN